MKLSEAITFRTGTGDLNLPEITFSDSILFRAETRKTRYESGTFWTLSYDIAQMYSRKTKENRRREIQVYYPRSVSLFHIDNVPMMNTEDKEDAIDYLVEWCERRGVEPEDTYTYDVLYGETDFAYPIQEDADFLSSLGFDGTHFSYEGGSNVDTVFLFGRGVPRQTEYLSDIISDEDHPLHSEIMSKLSV